MSYNPKNLCVARLLHTETTRQEMAELLCSFYSRQNKKTAKLYACSLFTKFILITPAEDFSSARSRIPKGFAVSRIAMQFLLSKDKVLSLLATSLLNRNPYGFPINGSPVF